MHEAWYVFVYGQLSGETTRTRRRLDLVANFPTPDDVIFQLHANLSKMWIKVG